MDGAEATHDPVFLCCGLPNEDGGLREAFGELPPEPYEIPDPPTRWAGDEEKETWRNGRLPCASDRSGDHPKEERLRRCGSALYYGEGHPWNVEAPLRGQVQTVPRSELRIFLDVIPRLQVPTTVLCDCLGVVEGPQALLRGQERG